MAALPICDELRRAVSTADWEPQFILFCQRAMGEDQRVYERDAELRCSKLDEVTKILGREFELRAREKDLFIENLKVQIFMSCVEDCKKRVLRLPSSALVFSFPLAVSYRSSVDSMAGADVDDVWTAGSMFKMSSAMNSPAPFALDDSFCFSIDFVARADVDDGVPAI
ncbi:hypothetical protein Tco_0706900 [Tanacetum coccineum]|uniref:Uncharacterized protein n=1 Tax=Tanacetum coccineum TaxID=301880 RepID=A0ABQ4Y8P5_9ASTR